MLQNELKAAIAKGELAGFFILCGEEDYLKRHYLSQIRQKTVAEDDPFATFNHIRFDGEALDLGAIENAVAAPPFMSEKKLIEWHFPNLNSLKEKEIEALEAMASSCKNDGYTTVVLLVGEEGLDIGVGKRKSKLFERLSDFCEIVVFDRSDDSRLANWIFEHLKREGVKADKSLCLEIIERVGHSMDLLVLEIDKLSAHLHANDRNTLTMEDIDTVASPTFESDAFGLTNAILDGDADAALADLRDKKLRRVEAISVVAAVARVFSDTLAVSSLMKEGMTQAEIAKRLKIHEYKVGLYIKAARKRPHEQLERAVHICKEIDVASKTSYADGYLGLTRLITEVLGTGRR